MLFTVYPSAAGLAPDLNHQEYKHTDATSSGHSGTTYLHSHTGHIKKRKQSYKEFFEVRKSEYLYLYYWI